MKDLIKEFILNHRVARLATVDELGNPHIVPIVYAFDGEKIYTPIDRKPKTVEPKNLKRIRNIEKNSSVSLIIDDYSEDWGELAWVQIRGESRILKEGKLYQKGIKLLVDKYPQYQEMKLGNAPLIIIEPVRILSWNSK